ncbi:uncharacterized protein EI97DRAFT_51967 [Westerdykella ornata]|uniref:Uncharacterized protein n=1 Tax=Westerdykella ornata TaxID=318751 RepID=A0A6A6JJ90_WESOR|nr:uncharacterized protein EI97DRAFT_51967 [Westerdykella ornata]KAF2276193.1 hypothetical protein EI97DRAFT_51967 [Westerdykella ornata]
MYLVGVQDVHVQYAKLIGEYALSICEKDDRKGNTVVLELLASGFTVVTLCCLSVSATANY